MQRLIFAFSLSLFSFAALAAEVELPTPTVKLGGVLFAEAVQQEEPKPSTSAFAVTRAYINITGTVGPLISFRITPDIARESGSGSSLSGSQTFRLKYAYGQINLDRWLTKGAYVRLGAVQTPYIDYVENIYRYRFQGPIMVDREGFAIASDNGVSMRYATTGDRLELYGGVYNGEGYSRQEQNSEKSAQLRATFRAAKGLRMSGFVNRDQAREGVARNRVFGNVTYEHARGTIGLELGTVKDASTRARAASLWATPKLGHHFEALLRYDHVRPNTDTSGKRRRDIEGIAYWLPLKNAQAAVMLDRDHTDNTNLDRPDEARYGLHVLLSF